MRLGTWSILLSLQGPEPSQAYGRDSTRTSLTHGLSSKSLAFGKQESIKSLPKSKVHLFFLSSLTPTQSLSNNGRELLVLKQFSSCVTWQLGVNLWTHIIILASLPRPPAQNHPFSAGCKSQIWNCKPFLASSMCQLIAHQIKHFLKQLIITTIFLVPTMCQADSRTPSWLMFSTSLEAPRLTMREWRLRNVNELLKIIQRAKAVTNMGPQSSVWFQPSRF